MTLDLLLARSNFGLFLFFYNHFSFHKMIQTKWDQKVTFGWFTNQLILCYIFSNSGSTLWWFQPEALNCAPVSKIWLRFRNWKFTRKILFYQTLFLFTKTDCNIFWIDLHDVQFAGIKILRLGSNMFSWNAIFS